MQQAKISQTDIYIYVCIGQLQDQLGGLQQHQQAASSTSSSLILGCSQCQCRVVVVVVKAREDAAVAVAVAAIPIFVVVMVNYGDCCMHHFGHHLLQVRQADNFHPPSAKQLTHCIIIAAAVITRPMISSLIFSLLLL